MFQALFNDFIMIIFSKVFMPNTHADKFEISDSSFENF